MDIVYVYVCNDFDVGNYVKKKKIKVVSLIF